MISCVNYGTDGWSGVPELKFKKLVAISHSVPTIDSNADYNVLCLLESESIVPNFSDNELNKFDLIITWREDILNRFSNSIKMIYGTTWIDQSKLNFKKEDKVSFLLSDKNFTKGHKLRQELYQVLSQINDLNGLSLFSIKTPPRINFKEEVLNSYKFSIIIENEKNNNYITEKIIDCFATKTIPIYWGSPNISEYFDANGIITFNSFSNFFEIVSKINNNTYNYLNEAIENNYNESKKYWSYWERIEDIIRKELNFD